MWTPKRILLVVLVLGLFVGCYAVYARQLGNIDGLPPLPAMYSPTDTGNDPPPRTTPPGAVVRKLETAFGRECRELKLPIKIEVPLKGIVLATREVTPQPDGRVLVIPLSVAIFGKNKGEDGTPEINTVRAELAYLTFEQPIQNVADMGKYKITAAQIERDIHVVNNRRTLGRDDDVSVEVSKGPLYYNAATQKIWSADCVEIQDMQSKPQPTRISGEGFVLELTTEQPHARDKLARPSTRKSETITGVKTALLQSAVSMDIFTEGKAGFLSNSATVSVSATEARVALDANSGASANPSPKPSGPPRPADPKKPPEKSHIIIKTQGPFHYDLVKDFATFDVPSPQPGRTSRYPEQVVVIRSNDPLGMGKLDHLLCEHLELQFRKKGVVKDQPGTSPPAAPATAKKQEALGIEGSSKEIEWAHAIGKSVILTSDAELLEAHGYDFFYDARTLTSTLKGKPMWAIQKGNEIQAVQLEMTNGDNQSARAQGPGTLSLFDSQSGKRPVRARWNQLLTTAKEGELDVIRLTGKAAFIDDENNQELHADDLRVWLLPQDKTPPKPASDKPKPSPGEQKAPSSTRRPHHLIATGNVHSRSKEFNIKDSQRFVVWFHDAPPGTPAPPDKSGKGTQTTTPGSKPAATGSQPATTAASTTKPGAQPADKKPDEKQPIDLWGRAIEAHVLRIGEKSQLQKMRSEGSVHVVQAPSKPGEKGVDIKGDTLNLTAHPEGNYLVVTGDLARLDMDKMLILGPEVNIDQVSNEAWVNGIGAMTIDSDTDFQGNKLKKPSPLTIHWNKAMLFSGPRAVFHGGIQADQDNARLTCQELQVFFDKPISLKENQKNDKDRAKVQHLTCDQSAIVEDSTIEKGKEIKYQQVRGRVIAYDNELGTVQVVGPGEVRLLQKGDADNNPDPKQPTRAPSRPAPSNNQKKDEEMKVTYVSFYTRMFGSRKTNMAHFYGDVRVLHMPGDNPRIDIDLPKIIGGKLPPGAMYIRSDELKVFTRPNPRGGKGWQEMHAMGHASVASPEFSGQADSVTYDEEKDQVIFDGGAGGAATLWKVERPGQLPQKIGGQQIIYSRKTGEHRGVGIHTIEGQ